MNKGAQTYAVRVHLVLVVMVVVHCETPYNLNEYQKSEQERQRSRATYYHQGKHVCLCIFLFLHNTGKEQFLNIKASCSENGLVSRVYGNTRRLPVHALSFDDVSRIVSFIRNYA